jgi:hypothetical protein
LLDRAAPATLAREEISMQLAKRLTLVAAVVWLGAVGGGCKKEEKKPSEPAAVKKDAGAGSGTSASAPKPPKAELDGFAAVAKTEAAGKSAGATTGGLGGLFGGGAMAEAEPTGVAQDDSDKDDMPPGPVEPDDEPADPVVREPEDVAFDIEFPPAAAKGGDCTAVTDRLAIIMQRVIEKQLAGASEEERAAAGPIMAEQMAGMKSTMATMCVDQKWSQELKDCALTATDQASFQACEKYAPKDVGGQAEPARNPASETVAAPAWTGGNACADVASRLRQLTLLQIGTLPADQQGAIDKALDDQVAEVTKACTGDKWPEATRDCIVHASTMDAVGECFAE